jgi:NADH:ubiquinone oxidoreductase subunit 4 (subunit M)
VRELSLLAPLAILVLILGLYPAVLLDKITPSTEAVLDHIEATTSYVTPVPGRISDVVVVEAAE